MGTAAKTKYGGIMAPIEIEISVEDGRITDIKVNAPGTEEPIVCVLDYDVENENDPWLETDITGRKYSRYVWRLKKVMS